MNSLRVITRDISILENDLLSALQRYQAAEKASDEATREYYAAAKALNVIVGQINLPHPDRLRALTQIKDGQ